MMLNSQRPPGKGLSVRHNERSRAPGEADMMNLMSFRAKARSADVEESHVVLAVEALSFRAKARSADVEESQSVLTGSHLSGRPEIPRLADARSE
jgi:hypothetical protein